MPEPRRYVVIFRSRLSPDDEGYADMAERMVELARRQPGFLGVESVRDGAEAVTLSYWASREAIEAWRSHPEHQVAMRLGRERWYARYSLEVAEVDRWSLHPEE